MSFLVLYNYLFCSVFIFFRKLVRPPYTRAIVSKSSMSSSDFVQTGISGGAPIGFASEGTALDMFRKVEIPGMLAWYHTMLAVFVVLIVIIAYLWYTRTKKAESFSCGTPGYQSALCYTGRDGPGESLDNQSLVSGFYADPFGACVGAQDDSGDPMEYVRSDEQDSRATTTTPIASPPATAAPTTEHFTSLSPADRLDRNLMISMQH